MVLATPSAHIAAAFLGPNSILKVGELESCKDAKRECDSLLESLNALHALLEVHAAAGVEQQSLQMVELYNSTLSHLDSARDRLAHIM